MFRFSQGPLRVVFGWRFLSVWISKEDAVSLGKGCAIALLPVLIGGCRYFPRPIVSECEQVTEVIAITETIPSYKGRSAAVYRGNQLDLAADRLGQLVIEDGELAFYSSPLVALYRQSSDLILQETALMEADGTVSVVASSRAAYQQALTQRAELTLQVQAQHDLVQVYCGEN